MELAQTAWDIPVYFAFVIYAILQSRSRNRAIFLDELPIPLQ